jgi:hypothetical protein
LLQKSAMRGAMRHRRIEAQLSFCRSLAWERRL